MLDRLLVTPHFGLKTIKIRCEPGP